MSQQQTPPGSPATPGASSATGSNRFFGWMRSLGITRTDGWIGGVCAGIAERIGIDPLIVRGIAVVAAVLGAPVLLFYAVAWALLPDRNGTIHAEKLVHGEFDTAMVGIGVLALLSLLPFTQGVWWAGAQFWGAPTWPEAILRSLWTLLVIGLIVAFVIWAARGAQMPPWAGGSTQNPRTASAGSAGPGYGSPAATAATATATTVASSAATASDTATGATTAPTVPLPPVDTTTEPTEPPAPPTDAPADDYAAWKARHASWQVQHNAWQARHDADMRAIRAQRAAENRARSDAYRAEAEARRREYRLANPRTSAAYVFATIGLALIASAITAIVVSRGPEFDGYEVTASLAVATIVFALAGVLAGALRRRSGFLGFLSILLLVATVTTAFLPRDRQLVLQPVGAWLVPSASASYAQPFGETTLVVDSASAGGAPGTPVVDLEKGPGTTYVLTDKQTTVRMELLLRGASVYSFVEGQGIVTAPACVRTPSGACSYDFVDGPKATPDVIVRIEQTGGEVQLRRNQEATGVQG
ncbi:PspC domain-containing protein [Diaminobutyricibacter tongyongensis]|uniref:PspC domain-containing protein n=1 Tax=Leifsonia tongyongensis TaxID=1268043 RepID=A0A6L9Y3S2_9MICO|nr:PspC domain-containing protein [Diaminobutyricibacter tongyongensis]NEN07864.1 PspC domain-containing protein [Diaminobutyricibacter tongyongensis]